MRLGAKADVRRGKPNGVGLPTNVGGGTEDVVYVLRWQDPILWEEGDGLPRQRRFEDVGSAPLAAKLLVYGCSAFSPTVSVGLSRITGTGLIAPAF